MYIAEALCPCTISSSATEQIFVRGIHEFMLGGSYKEDLLKMDSLPAKS